MPYQLTQLPTDLVTSDQLDSIEMVTSEQLYSVELATSEQQFFQNEVQKAQREMLEPKWQ